MNVQCLPNAHVWEDIPLSPSAAWSEPKRRCKTCGKIEPKPWTLMTGSSITTTAFVAPLGFCDPISGTHWFGAGGTCQCGAMPCTFTYPTQGGTA